MAVKGGGGTSQLCLVFTPSFLPRPGSPSPQRLTPAPLVPELNIVLHPCSFAAGWRLISTAPRLPALLDGAELRPPGQRGPADNMNREDPQGKLGHSLGQWLKRGSSFSFTRRVRFEFNGNVFVHVQKCCMYVVIRSGQIKTY